jgi:peptide deformylase
MRSIVQVPNPILTTPAKTVTVFDKKLQAMIADMKKILLSAQKPKGVGLAGPQAGYPYRIFLTKPAEKKDIRVFINPHIITLSEEMTDGVPERENKLEGCLSIPDVWGKVKRHHSLTLRYLDITGKTIKEEFSGFMATIIQHETDHINGILFTSRVLEQKGKFYQTAKDENGKEILEELELK